MNFISSLCWIAISALVFIGGVSCVSFTAPGSLADFTTITDPAGPQATFPAHLALERLQGSGYQNDETHAFASGCYRVMTQEDLAPEGTSKCLVAVKGIQDLGRKS